MTCITCGYWEATDSDQCEACATSTRTRRRTLTGVVTRHTYAQWRKGGRTPLSNLILDVVSPLPASELWSISFDDPSSKFKNDSGRPYRFVRTRSGKLPGSLPRELEGKTVTITAIIEPWSNGLGGYMSAVKLVGS